MNARTILDVSMGFSPSDKLPVQHKSEFSQLFVSVYVLTNIAVQSIRMYVLVLVCKQNTYNIVNKYRISIFSKTKTEAFFYGAQPFREVSLLKSWVAVNNRKCSFQALPRFALVLQKLKRRRKDRRK